MTLRKQLELQLAAIRVVWAMTPPAPVPRIGEATLECRPAVPPMAAIRGARGRVNAFPVGGAGAGYLLVRAVTTEPVAAGGDAGFRVIVRVAYREKPWIGVAADLDALLDALEAGAGAEPGRPETWRTRKGML
jgi:hypothetical protein